MTQTQTSASHTHHVIEALLPFLTPITDIELDPDNARLHPENNLHAIAQSLDRYGQRTPIVVQVKDGRRIIRKGNGTFTAATGRLGWTHIAAVFVEEDDQSATGYAIADNRTGELAEWDFEVLAKLLHDLPDADMDATGFQDTDLASILNQLDKLSAPEPEQENAGLSKPEELLAKWQVKSGDIWAIGPHRLMCGDSTEREDVQALMDGDLADLVFTDPPYGVAYQGGTADALTIENDALNKADLRVFLEKAFDNIHDLLKPGGAFYVCSPAGDMETVFRNALEAVGLELRQCIVWAKDRFVMGRQDYHWQHESILYGWKSGAAHFFVDDRTQSTVWNVDRPSANPLHPTMKPIELVGRAVRNSSAPRQIVVDLFGGSGSTMEACNERQRVCYSMEYDPKYCAVILERLTLLGLKAERVGCAVNA